MARKRHSAEEIVNKLRQAERRDHVWAYDFVHERTTEGKPLRMLVVVGD